MRYQDFLPAPWEELENGLPTDEQAALERVVGSRIAYEDLTDDDVARDGAQSFPRSLRARWAMGHRWVRLRNRDTGDEFVLRLQFKGDGTREAYVSAVISPFQNGRETTGAQLRALPVSAIGAAYTKREIGNAVALNRALVLGNAIDEDPLKPLPNGRVTDQAFLAKVGRQYDAMEERHAGEDVGAMMAELNGVAPSTARKWLTAARKALFLMPVAAGRKRG
ncbi:hypothetical protein [Bifidobacterium leontopitheci]|uniref:Uncharacterized protein n=1 Tax=Bifidobacterium leontopitheci TaxID=2650774 RepID=A0A6I1GMK5_9BIFI|nr:hypothetical protein [Bifidobacterium leontopitheci]KAB7790567.1 hypothetical protein F7D09_0936 [Bifidobacterium leontopitheci]